MLTNSYSRESPEKLNTEVQSLAVIGFDDPITRLSTNHIPSGVGRADDSEYLLELWNIHNESVIRGISGRCQWSESDSFLFTSISLNKEECMDLVEATRSAYIELLAHIKHSKQPNLIRFWNYVPAINEGLGDNENYKLFCNGRLEAFEAAGVSNDDFPAATGIGHITSGMAIYAISSAYKGQHHANAQQQNAYKYPRQYGKSSPSFARATTLEYPDGNLLFISGTASIIGHKTLHEGDLTAQLQTTKENILHLLHKTVYSTDTMQTMKVYLRDKSCLEESKKSLDHDFPNAAKIYTIADICRSDLLVEVECFCSLC